MMKTTISILLTIFLISSVTSQDSGLEQRELLVEKEYSNEIYETNPIFDFASIIAPKSKPKVFDDSLSRINLHTPDIDILVRPIGYETAAQTTNPAGFVKLDKGFLNPLHGQAGYTIARQITLT